MNSFKIKTVTLSRTFNLENFNSLRLELCAEIFDNADTQKVFKILENECKKYKESR